MIKSSLRNTESGKELRSEECFDDKPILTVATYGQQNGHFKAATRTSAGTTTVVTPYDGDAIVLTDLILTTDRVALSTVTVSFTDGVNTVTIISTSCADAPCNIAIPFSGLWRGWESARIDLTTVAGLSATLAIGYFHVKGNDALQYSQWDALRQ
jgi:hypothetical protein